MMLKNVLLAIYPNLNDNEFAILMNLATIKNIKKGSILLQADKKEHYLYFIIEGRARAYTHHDLEEITFWFGGPGNIILSMNNYVYQTNSYENVAFLTDGLVAQFSLSQLEQAYQGHIGLANWGRKIAEKELVQTELRLLDRQEKSAATRYHTLLSEQPELLQYVPLKYIASYLGITPISLSRIRAQLGK